MNQEYGYIFFFFFSKLTLFLTLIHFFFFKVGIEFDSPVGKNDGSYDGKQYFSCPPKHGSFFNPEKLLLLEEVFE